MSEKTDKQMAAIAWVLAEVGDINADNATAVLRQHLADREGIEWKPQDLGNRFFTLESRGQIERLVENNRVYSIRLLVDPQLVGPNPWGAGTPVVSVVPPNETPNPTYETPEAASQESRVDEETTLRGRLALASEALNVGLDRVDQALALVEAVDADLARLV